LPGARRGQQPGVVAEPRGTLGGPADTDSYARASPAEILLACRPAGAGQRLSAATGPSSGGQGDVPKVTALDRRREGVVRVSGPDGGPSRLDQAPSYLGADRPGGPSLAGRRPCGSAELGVSEKAWETSGPGWARIDLPASVPNLTSPGPEGRRSNPALPTTPGPSHPAGSRPTRTSKPRQDLQAGAGTRRTTPGAPSL